MERRLCRYVTAGARVAHRDFLQKGRVAEAYRDINGLLADCDKLAWIWPWCTRLVAMYGRGGLDAAQSAIQFWNAYLSRNPDDTLAKRERLLCIWTVHAGGKKGGYRYDAFKATVEELVRDGVPDPAFLWDRAGHWAQDEGEWEEAEICYRKAFELSPDQYGYCLGTALNFLRRFEEALPMLLLQAKIHQADAMSWFQVAVAREGIGDVQGCIAAYRRVLELDNNNNYDLAWFNLGGMYWNSQMRAEAISTWKEAMQRFPEHELSSRLRSDLPDLWA